MAGLDRYDICLWKISYDMISVGIDIISATCLYKGIGEDSRYLGESCEGLGKPMALA